MHGVENNDGRHFLVGQEFVSHRLCLVGDGLAGGARGRCPFCSRILLRYLFFKIVAVDGAVAQFRTVAIHRVDRDAEDGGDLCAVCDADAQECQEAQVVVHKFRFRQHELCVFAQEGVDFFDEGGIETKEGHVEAA